MLYKKITLLLVLIFAINVFGYTPRIFYQDNTGANIYTENASATLTLDSLISLGGILTQNVTSSGVITDSLVSDSLVLNPASVEPFTCAELTKGAIYFDELTKTHLSCDGTSWIAMGGGSGVGSSETMALLDAEDEDISGWDISGLTNATLTVNATTPLNGEFDYEIAITGTATNEFVCTPNIPVPTKTATQPLGVDFAYSYDGEDNDLLVSLYDVTNTSTLETVYVKSGQGLRLETIGQGQSTAELKICYSILTANDGKTFRADDLQFKKIVHPQVNIEDKSYITLETDSTHGTVGNGSAGISFSGGTKYPLYYSGTFLSDIKGNGLTYTTDSTNGTRIVVQKNGSLKVNAVVNGTGSAQWFSLWKNGAMFKNFGYTNGTGVSAQRTYYAMDQNASIGDYYDVRIYSGTFGQLSYYTHIQAELVVDTQNTLVVNEDSNMYIDTRISSTANVWASTVGLNNSFDSSDGVMQLLQGDAQIPCSSGNAPSGLTCSSGSESLGIAFNSSSSGLYKICGWFSATASSDFSSKWVEVDSSGAVLQDQIVHFNLINYGEEASTNWCSTFDISAGEHIFKLVNSRTTGSGAFINDSSGVGSRAHRITVEKVFTAPRLLTLPNSKQNDFSATLDTTGNILSSNGDFISSVSSASGGVVNVVYKTGIFTVKPAVTAVVSANSGQTLSVYNESATGFTYVMVLSNGSAITNQNANIFVSKQSPDYTPAGVYVGKVDPYLTAYIKTAASSFYYGVAGTASYKTVGLHSVIGDAGVVSVISNQAYFNAGKYLIHVPIGVSAGTGWMYLLLYNISTSANILEFNEVTHSGDGSDISFTTVPMTVEFTTPTIVEFKTKCQASTGTERTGRIEITKLR